MWAPRPTRPGVALVIELVIARVAACEPVRQDPAAQVLGELALDMARQPAAVGVRVPQLGEHRLRMPAAQVKTLAKTFGEYFACEPPTVKQVREAIAQTLSRWPVGSLGETTSGTASIEPRLRAIRSTV